MIKKILYTGSFEVLEKGLAQELKTFQSKKELSELKIIVPNFQLTHYLKLEMSKRLGFLFNIEFKTLHDFLKTTIQEKQIQEDWKIIPDEIIPHVLKNLLQLPMDVPSYFQSVRETSGFYRLLANTIMDIHQGLFDSQTIRKAVQRYSNNKSYRQRTKKWEEIAKYVEIYGNWKKDKKILDSSDLYYQSLNLVLKSPIWIYGFYDATALQKKILKHVTSFYPSIWFVPYEDKKAYGYAEPFLKWIQSLSSKPTHMDFENAVSENMYQLREVLFEDKPNQPMLDIKNSCKVILSSNVEQEISDAVKYSIKYLEKDKDKQAPRSIAFLLRYSDPYLKVFKPVLESLQVPYGFHLPQPLNECAESRIISLLLTCLEDGWMPEWVISILSSPKIQWKFFKIHQSKWNRTNWIFEIRKAYKQFGDHWMSKIYSKESRTSNSNINLDLMNVIHVLQKMKVEFQNQKTIFQKMEYLVKKISQLFLETDIQKKILGKLKNFEEFMNPLDLLNQEKLSVIVQSLMNSKIYAMNQDINGIQIVDIMETRGVSFDIVILPGLIEKWVPQFLPQDPILLDDERSIWNQMSEGEQYLPLKSDLLLEERLLFYLSVCSAKKLLIVSAPIWDLYDGNPQIISSYLFQLLNLLYPQIDFKIHHLIQQTENVFSIFPEKLENCVSEMDFLLFYGKRSLQKNSNDFFSIAQSIPFFIEGLQLIQHRNLPTFTSFDGMIQPHQTLNDVNLHNWTASKFETYLQCPMQYFYQYILNLDVESNDQDALRVGADQKGQWIHRFLEKCVRFGLEHHWFDGNLKQVESQEVESIYDQISQEFSESNSRSENIFWKNESLQLKFRMVQILKRILEDQQWVPWKVEVPFDEQGQFVNFPLHNGKTIRLRGKIDRIDISRDQKNLRVVDYKSGQLSNYPEKDIQEGKKIQLHVYAWICKHNYPDKDVESARYEFIDQDKKKYSRNGPSLKPFKQFEEKLSQWLQNICEAVELGKFPSYFNIAKPPCDYCKFKMNCGTEMKSRAEFKQQDLQIQFLKEKVDF
jgi:ATP-dependent helicase/DNAse subunit B